MGEKRGLWVRSFPLSGIPAYRCPHCSEGMLRIDEETLQERRLPDSLVDIEVNGYDPTYDYRRFTVMLLCTRCKCPVAVSGVTREKMYYDEDDSIASTTFYHPESMIPGPPLAEIPPDTPEPVELALRQGFTAFWGSLGASANRLRVAAERILDDRKVKRFTINAKRKRQELSLASRIEIYATSKPEHKGFLTVLRWVGNVGSHAGDVDRDDLLTAYEHMQEGLREIYGVSYRKDLERRGRELVKRRGRPAKTNRRVRGP